MLPLPETATVPAAGGVPRPVHAKGRVEAGPDAEAAVLRLVGCFLLIPPRPWPDGPDALLRAADPAGLRPEQARRSQRRVGGRSCARPLRAVRSRARLSQPRDGWRGARSPCAGWTTRCHYWAVKAPPDGALACYTPIEAGEARESADALVDRAFRLSWHGRGAEADRVPGGRGAGTGGPLHAVRERP